MLSRTLLPLSACVLTVGTAMAWAVEQRFEMPVWDALRVLFS